MSSRRPIFQKAHGEAKKYGAILVAESPRLTDLEPLDAARTVEGVAAATRRGRPFEPGNTAASTRGSSLTRVTTSPTSGEEQRRVDRRAQVLAAERVREFRTMYGGTKPPTVVRVEVAAWARNTAWSDFYFSKGEAKEGARHAELASAHALKAAGAADREMKAGATDANVPWPGMEWVTDEEESPK